MSLHKKSLRAPHSVEKEIEKFVQNFQRKSQDNRHVEFDTLSINSVPDIRRIKFFRDCPETSSVSTIDSQIDASDDSSYVEIMSQSESSDVSSNVKCSPLVKQRLHRPESRLLQLIRRKLDDVMADKVCQYSVLDVASLLQGRYAFISGGKDKEGGPVLTFPDNVKAVEPPEEEFKKIVEYLCSVPVLCDREIGFVIVVDRRQSAWSSVKVLMHNMSIFFPFKIKSVFLLKPTGFFQRAFSDYRSKFKDDLNFQVIICDKPSDIYPHIEPSQLTKDVGGEIQYDHNEWIEIRMAVEKFGKNTYGVSEALQSLATRYWEMEYPNDVEGTERIIREHIMERKDMIEDLTSVTHHGGSLLACVKGDNPEAPLVKRVHIESLEKLLSQLDETHKAFEEFWNRHEVKLKQCLQLRQFEDEFKLIQYSADRNIEFLSKKVDLLVDSLPKLEELMSQFTDFKEHAEKDIEKAERLHRTGKHLMENDHYAVDSIRPKCVELQRMCDQYKQLLRRRQEMLTRSHDLHQRIDKATKWCSKGLELLTAQELERYNTHENAGKAIEDIEQFLNTSEELRLSNPKEFRTLFESLYTPDTKNKVQVLLKRIEDVQEMCQKRKDSLKRLAVKQKPAIPVNSDHVIMNIEGPRPPVDYTPETQRKILVERNSRFKSSKRDKFRRSRSDSGEKNNNTKSTSDLLDLDGSKSKQRQIFMELIDTEKSYVSELYDIVCGYMYEMDDITIQHIIPTALLDKKAVLFGNIEEIYQFHNDIFLNELQSHLDDPASVGLCFIDRREDFKLYSTYCQNKPKSENLRNAIKDDNPFFKECQRKLGHKLPLSAYLLKPVQRITKYQLLLKEMLKCSEESEDTASREILQDALSGMLHLLKHVNDLMHQVAITGFTGSLSEQGKLLMQGSFNVWTEHKKEKIRDFRFKPQQRHVFLYEKAILMCKKKEDSGPGEKAHYGFKTYLMTSQIGLTEAVKGDRKFEIWLPDREEVYTLQATTAEEKELWCLELRKLLILNRDKHMGVKKKLMASKSQDNLTALSPESWRTSMMGSIHNTSVGIIHGLVNSSQEHLDDENGWSSSEFSTLSDESSATDRLSFVPNYRQKFRSISMYEPIDENELRMCRDDVVEVLRVGSKGWWYVSHVASGACGWVPASYLQPLTCRSMDNLAMDEDDGLLYSVKQETTV